MPAIPTHLDLGIALLILGVLALLAFSPWFRRFALVCVALLVVAAGVVYMKINQENEQAMARECAPIPGQTIPNPPDLQEKCDKRLAEHPQAKAEFMAQKCSYFPAGFPSAEAWQRALEKMGGETPGCDEHPQAKAESAHPQAKD